MHSGRLIAQNRRQAKLHSLLQSFQLWLLGKIRNHHFSKMCYDEHNCLLSLSALNQTLMSSCCFFLLMEGIKSVSSSIFIWLGYCALHTKLPRKSLHSLPIPSCSFINTDYCKQYLNIIFSKKKNTIYKISYSVQPFMYNIYREVISIARHRLCIELCL